MKKWICRAASALLLAALLTCLFLPVGAESAGNYDFSRPGSSSTASLSAGDLLSLAYGEELSPAEKEFLLNRAPLSLSYEGRIPTSFVSAVCHPEDESVTVYAFPYVYRTAGGEEISFLPSRVSIGDKTSDFTPEGDAFVAAFTGVPESDEAFADVLYETSFTVAKEDLDAVGNSAIAFAKDAKARVDLAVSAYESEREAYLSAKSAYETYLSALSAYESALAVYREYSAKYRVYLDALSLYRAYLVEREAYETDLALYENYAEALAKYNADTVKYLSYLREKEEYDSRRAEYDAYLETLAAVRHQLSGLDLINVKMKEDRTLYAAVMGSTVDEVLNNKSLITSSAVGVSKEVVNLAGSSTEALRTLMNDYLALTGEAARYAYYTVNYDALCQNFADLLRTLDKLYQNKKVRAELEIQEKDWKYELLLAQLYLVVNALSDTPVKNYDGTASFDSSYRINGKTVAKVLENKTYYTDTNAAAPLSGGYPAPVAEPAVPVSVEEPVKPEPRLRPVEPEPVEEPVPPLPVVEEPIAPSPVPAPGDEPVPYVATAWEAAMILALGEGLLSERAPLASDLTVARTVTVHKKLYNVTEATVSFYDESGEVLLCRTTVDSGTFAGYIGEIPEKEEDVGATYTFAGWQDDRGTPVDLSAVDGDLVVYPRFTAHPKSYPVTWVTPDGEVTELVEYGKMPVGIPDPTCAEDDKFYYVFEGWDEEVLPVTGAARYAATFSSHRILPYTGGGAVIFDDGQDLVADCHSWMDQTLELSPLIARAAGKRGVVLDTGRGKIRFSYSDVLALSAVSAPKISIRAVQSGTKYCRYRVELSDEAGVPCEMRLYAELPCGIARTPNSRLYSLTENGEKRYVSFTAAGGSLAFTLECGVEYTFLEEFPVDITVSGDAAVASDVPAAAVGDPVRLFVDLPAGAELVSFSVSDISGAEVEKDGTGAYRMPAGGLVVRAVSEPIDYLVSFTSDGKTIASYRLHYGDAVTPPAAPIRAADGKYAYTFLGWSPEVGAVTEDVTYEAIFFAEALPEKPPEEGLIISPGVLKKLVFAGAAAYLFLAVFLPSGVLTATFAVRARKKRTGKREK